MKSEHLWKATVAAAPSRAAHSGAAFGHAVRRGQRVDAPRRDRGSDREPRRRGPGRRPLRRRARDAPQHPPLRRQDRRRRRGAARRHHRRAEHDRLRRIARRAARSRAQPTAGVRRQPRHRHRHDPHQGRLPLPERRPPAARGYQDADAGAALRARVDGHARPAGADAGRPHAPRHRRRRVRRHRGLADHRGRGRGDRRRDRGRA